MSNISPKILAREEKAITERFELPKALHKFPLLVSLLLSSLQVWDDLLAKTAQKWVMSCSPTGGHDLNRFEPGQNK